MSRDRDQLLREIVEQAERRRLARETADEALAEIARLLPAVIAAGVSKREISRRTGLSRVTMDRLLRERGASAS